ncbi:UNVERIFIED_CONTAM: hypothetical protein NCL1_13891 [Trichonephila clavipes]
MLNDDQIVTSVREESDSVDDETVEDEDNNNESSKEHALYVGSPNLEMGPGCGMGSENGKSLVLMILIRTMEQNY